jgi:IS5 family transposase
VPLERIQRLLQQRREDKKKLYSLHAPEVECIGKGKPHARFEFGVKVSVATTNARAPGGQFVVGMRALPGNPYDGHTLATVIPAIESTIGAALDRIVTDAGYKGHNAPKDQRFKVYVAGQKRGLTAAIKRAFRRRSAVEPTIGHLKNEHRMGRNHLAGRAGDAVNAVLAAAGYNFRLLLRWLALWLQLVLAALTRPSHPSLTFVQP